VYNKPLVARYDWVSSSFMSWGSPSPTNAHTGGSRIHILISRPNSDKESISDGISLSLPLSVCLSVSLSLCAGNGTQGLKHV
jgi:hypothetical protein